MSSPTPSELEENEILHSMMDAAEERSARDQMLREEAEYYRRQEEARLRAQHAEEEYHFGNLPRVVSPATRPCAYTMMNNLLSRNVYYSRFVQVSQFSQEEGTVNAPVAISEVEASVVNVALMQPLLQPDPNVPNAAPVTALVQPLLQPDPDIPNVAQVSALVQPLLQPDLVIPNSAQVSASTSSQITEATTAISAVGHDLRSRRRKVDQTFVREQSKKRK